MTDINKAIEEIIAEIYALTVRELIELTRINSNSDLVKSIEVESVDNTIVIKMNKYALYIDSGRRPFVKYIPFKVLLDWVNKNRIEFPGQSKREVAYIIQRSIYKKGIQPRKWIDQLGRDIEKLTGERLETEIFKSIDIKYEQLFKTGG
jgi:hypothetical protein